MIKLKDLLPEATSTKTIDAYEMETWFRGWVENEIDEDPNQTMDLLFAYKKRKTSLKTTMSFTEEVKDGRSPYFNEKLPLRLKGKTFDDAGVQTTIVSIKLIDKHNQDSDYNDYQVTSYDVTFKIKYGKDAPIFESNISESGPPFNRNFIPNVGEIDDWKLKELLTKNPKFLPSLTDEEKEFFLEKSTDVVGHSFSLVITDGIREFAYNLKKKEVTKHLKKARKSIVQHYKERNSKQ